MTGPDDLIGKALGESSIRPKMFNGGALGDYRLSIGENSTLLSEHIPSGKKVPAVEVDGLAEAASKVPQLDRNGKIVLAAAATALTAVTVVTVYKLVQKRKTRKENEALRAEVAHLRGSEVIEGEVVREEAAVGGAGPILSTGSTAPGILDPMPVRVAEPVRTRTGSAPTAHQTAGTTTRSSHLDDRGAVGIEVIIEATTATSDDRVVTTTVDWAHTVESQVQAARDEERDGNTHDGIARLIQLLFFLDEVPGKQGSPLYPAITVEPLLALVELSIGVPLQEMGEESPVGDWLSRLRDHAEVTGDDDLRRRVEDLGTEVD